MADSPCRIRTPWLPNEVSGATRERPGFGLQAVGGEDATGSSRSGGLWRLLCRAALALGLVAAPALAARHWISRVEDGSPEYELIFEGEVPHEESFALHVGSLCFGASAFVGPPDLAPPAGGIRLEVQADQNQDWHADHGHQGQLQSELRAEEQAWKTDNVSLNQADVRGLVLFQSLGKTSLPIPTVSFVPWGETVHGRATKNGIWLEISGGGLLPFEVGGVPVLQQQIEAFLVDNSLLHAEGDGLLFHSSESHADRGFSSWARWGDTVHGYVTRSGRFLSVPGRGFLSMEAYGFPVLRRPQPAAISDRRAAEISSHVASKPLDLAQGDMAWLLFDDQETHWGRAARTFASSDIYEKYEIANTVMRFLPPPWPNRSSVMSAVLTKERSARHLHIVLASGGVGLAGRAPARYRVWARGQLTSAGPGEFAPEKCPRQPMLWVRRKAQQLSEYIQV